LEIDMCDTDSHEDHAPEVRVQHQLQGARAIVAHQSLLQWSREGITMNTKDRQPQ